MLVIEVVAVVLFATTVVAWCWVATPQLVTAWLSFARDLDPSRAPQHATLFSSPRSTG
jgi:hypothetical protein